MNVLTINCGSSTLKFQLYSLVAGSTAPAQRLAGGIVDRIGGQGTVDFVRSGGRRHRADQQVSDHAAATRVVLDWLRSQGLLEGRAALAVGHRVVHGADRFAGPTLIDEGLIQAIEELGRLAPLHNGPALEAIRSVSEELGTSIPQVATFDTAFHRTLPETASRYAIPSELADKHHIRRYGFHGLAHCFMARRYAEIAGIPLEKVNIITLQLGNGCSATAVRAGRSVDTSMGFTPLEGLMMGTRSGDVDPSLAGFLARREGLRPEEAESWLNTRSGLLGVSGLSRDMRELLDAEARGDGRSSLAVDMFCYRVRKYIGAYLAVLGGAQAVVFGGGIGENSPPVRARILEGMEWCGLHLDGHRNLGTLATEGRISTDGSGVHAYVIPVDEGRVVLQDTVACLRREGIMQQVPPGAGAGEAKTRRRGGKNASD